MRRITKIMGLLLFVGVLVLGFASCKDSENKSNNTSNTPIDEEVIYSPYINTTLTLGEGVDEQDVNAVKTAYYKKTGKEFAAGTGGSHQIIVGKTDNELSEKAYRYLERFKEDEEYVGYVIYSDGKSVAIAFDEASFGEDIAFSEAIKKFVSEYMKAESLKLGAGVVYTDAFDPIEKQEACDAANLKELWDFKLSQISAKLHGDEEKSEAVIYELQALYNILNNNYSIVSWLANLYDPVTGGFYYSNSARNNEGYLPDLESTSQALGIIKSILTGYGGTLTDYFGEEIANKFVSFAKNMQKPNGYFYHLQWKDITDSNTVRKNLDVLAALNILSDFNASPTYDTPNGVKGDGVVTPASRLTLPFNYNKAEAVSALVSSESDEIYIPSYMKSKDAFETYLSGLNIKSNTEAVCQELNSNISLYIAVDELLEEQGANYRLSELLTSYLTRNQNSYTGLWGSSSEATSDSIGLLSEITKLYDGTKQCMPNYENIFSTIEKYINFDEEPTNISDISKAWSSLAAVVNNITTYGRDNQYSALSVENALSSLYYEFEEILKTTREKLLLFIRDDGSFSTLTTGSASEQYGMSVALPLTDEGDINATLLASKNIYLSVFRVLGLGDVPIFNTSDRMMFQKTLLNMGVIIKNEIKEVEAEDFEFFEIGDTANVQIVESGDSSAERYSEVVDGSEDHGNVLKLYSSGDAGQDQFHFSAMSTVNGASCYSYELDICVTPEYQDGMSSFIILYKFLHLIGIERDGDVVKLTDRSSQWGAACISDLGARAKVGEWFKLRVEYYPVTNKTVRVKIFFNRECIAVTDSYFGKEDETAAPSTEYTGFAVFAASNKEMSLLVDNVVTQSSYKSYIPETSSDLNINVDALDRGQKIYDFEDFAVGSMPSDFKLSGDASAVTVVGMDNGEGYNQFMSVSEKAGEIVLPLVQRGSDANSAVIEFDIIVDKNAAAGTNYRINFNEYLYNERNFAAMQLMVVEEGGSKYATFAEVSSGKAGEPNSNIELTLGTSYRLRFQLFFEEQALVVSIGNDIVAISGNVIKDCKKYYMGEVTLDALTPSIKSTILIDNIVCERIRSNFAEVTAPEFPREEYGFDSSEGAEIYGISPSGGMLSFNDISGSEAYIKIPVNTRVNVPTLSVITFDVIQTEKTYGEMVVELTDKSGNVIAAFSLVRNGSSVDIHEYTQNGRYPTPIYTVAKTSFTLSIKYNEDKQGFNLFVDDNYTASSSLLDTDTSGEYEFEYVKISCTVSTGIAIDNLSAEKICGIFITSAASDSNTDNTSSVLTYENSSFASMPNKIEPSLGSLSSYLNIKEGNVNDAVSKVLEFYSSTDTADIIIFKQTQNMGGNASFFETDMMLKSDGGKMMSLMQFRAVWNGSYPTVYNFRLETNGPSEPIQLTTNDAKIDLKVKEGEWFKLRIEYADTPYDYNYDGENDPIVRVYVNDMENPVGEGHTLNNSSILPPASTVTQVRVTVSAGYEGAVLYDNTSLGQFTMTYEKPIDPDKETLTFSPGVVTNKTVFALASNKSSYGIIDMANAESAANKVLEFYTATGNKDKLTVSTTMTLENANASMFEADIMITPETDAATFYLEPMTSKNKQPFRLTLTANKDGKVTITDPQNSDKEIEIGESGKWIHLKVEYMNPMLDYTDDGDSSADILYKIYSDGAEKTIIGYKPYSSTSYYKPTDITKWVFTTEAASAAEIIFDNISFWQIELTPDEAPEFESSGNSNLGDNWFSDSGWS